VGSVRSISEASHRESIEDWLGPDLRVPAPIPRDYAPSEVSAHRVFRVELEDFGGPLDLLLFLVRRHELNIFDIPIHFITARYLEMLDSMTELSVDVSAEFLVLAAELIQIKSKMLLPVDEGVAVAAEHAEEEGRDPREELVRRLLAYQKYREAAEALDARDRLGRDVFARLPPPPERVIENRGIRPENAFRLVEIMSRMARKKPKAHEIVLEQFSIRERSDFVFAFASESGGSFGLRALFGRCDSRGKMVVTFIALLEMTRLGMLRISVDEGLVSISLTGKDLREALVDDYR
jgi:segregation and condensation protein A